MPLPETPANPSCGDRERTHPQSPRASAVPASPTGLDGGIHPII